MLVRALTAAAGQGEPTVAILDERGRAAIERRNPALEISWFQSSVFGRFKAEHALSRLVHDDDTILCFHSLPPIFARRGNVICFVHSPNLTGLVSPSALSSWVRVRSAIEKFIFLAFSSRVDRFVVQTPSMAAALRKLRGVGKKPIAVLPFVDPCTLPEPRPPETEKTSNPDYDFVYVSDGAAHKNHRALFAAWKILAENDSFPTLALTLHPQRDYALRQELARLINETQVRIVDLGQMDHEQALELYKRVGALIFASFAETFGIPLIEAAKAGVPIVAAEKDFVRDVCIPSETFDPDSPRSIARAVRRYLGNPEPPIEMLAPRDFLTMIHEERPNADIVTGVSSGELARGGLAAGASDL